MNGIPGYVALVAVLGVGCTAGGGPDPELGRAVTAAAGEPLPGLAADLTARFAAGREIFHREFTPEEGLGPLYNQKRCSSCHDLPVLGGFGAEPVLKATHWDTATGTCDLLEELGGEVVQNQVTEALRERGILPESVPEGANAVAGIKPPPLFALGLIEAVPDAEILSRADPDDAVGDGISGRAARTADGRLGRFGRRLEIAGACGHAPSRPAGLRRRRVPGLPTPAMTTGPNEVAALDRKTVALYSDLLIHDLGPEVASICGAGAGPSGFRTAPLLGLGLRQPYLHDDRAQTLDDAVRAHGGEAEASRVLYERLGTAERAALLRFLRSL